MSDRPIEILLIEDNEADVDLTREALIQHKMLANLHVAKTGEDGLLFLTRTGTYAGVVRPDIVLLDLNLPGLSGREVLKKMKNDLNLKQIPVVVLTTSEADLDILKSYSMGANCYIVKPVDFQNFSNIVMQIEDFWFNIAKLPRRELVEKYLLGNPSLASELPQKLESTQPIHVLYIEDSDADADLIFESLKNLTEPQFVSHRATRLEEAFDYLKTHVIDIVLLDLTLPDSQGFETVARFLEQSPNLPMIVLTGNEDKALGIRAVKMGAQDYLVKGQVEGEFLGRLIRHAIERKLNILILGEAFIREQAAREQAEKAIGIRDEFLSIASHELRTPLTSLKLQMQLLTNVLKTGEKDEILQERFQTMAEMAERQIGRFSQLIETLLDISQIQSGRLKLEYSKFDLNEILKESIERLSPELTKAGCEIKMNLNQKVVGEWDRLRLEQVFINLLSNGIKYAAGKPLEISVSSDSESVQIQIQDHGRGIAAKDKEKIFQRFERVGETKSVSGLGLGLYVVRQIIDSHGGTIKVESDLGKGTTFKIRIPFHPPKSPIVLQPEKRPSELGM